MAHLEEERLQRDYDSIACTKQDNRYAVCACIRIAVELLEDKKALGPVCRE